MITAILAATLAATPLPRFDVADGCARNATRIHNPASVQLCVDDQQGAYDWAKIIWPVVPEPVRASCATIAARVSIPGYGYTLLSECLVSHMAEIEAANPRPFRR